MPKINNPEQDLNFGDRMLSILARLKLEKKRLENEKLVKRVVELAFRSLYEISFFDTVPEVVRLQVQWNDAKLSSLDYKCAATIEEDIVKIILRSNFDLDRDIDAIIHESIHLAQMLKGDLVPGFGDGTMMWKKETYQRLPANDERYFQNQPWEAEANEVLPLLIKKINGFYKNHA